MPQEILYVVLGFVILLVAVIAWPSIYDVGPLPDRSPLPSSLPNKGAYPVPDTTADDLFVRMNNLDLFSAYVTASTTLDDSVKAAVQSTITTDKATVSDQAAAAIVAFTPPGQSFPDIVEASDNSLHIVSADPSTGKPTLNVAVVVHAADIPLAGASPAPVPEPAPAPIPGPSPVDPNAPTS